MKRWLSFVTSLLLMSLSSVAAAQSIVEVDGSHLSINQVVQIAKHGARVNISESSLVTVKRSHDLLMLAGQKGFAIYGLSRGVGLNKDKTIFHGSIMTEQAKKASEDFNKNILHAHSAGIGPAAPVDVVRAAMVVRLNELLTGHAGVQVPVVLMLRDFLNKDITPVLPARGSVGEADITILAHVGLAMMGEGDVFYHQKRISAKIALQKEGLTPLRPYAKDALSILSSNAYTSGKAALVLADVGALLEKYDLIVALSLEGINGNIAPILDAVHKTRPYTGQGISAQHIRDYLRHSYLWEVSTNRALQDPLSFRTASQVNGAAREVVTQLKQSLELQLNSSDDNPSVILDIASDNQASAQERSYYLNENGLRGAVIPTANFEPIPWVLKFEELAIALAHLSASSTQRTMKLGSDCFTRLSRFLAPDETAIAFGAIQKPIVFLNTEIQQLSNAVSVYSYPVAGDIEDTATNALLVVERVDKIVDDLYQILGFELIHANQAVDLRLHENQGLRLGEATNALHQAFRQRVPFLDKDRTLTPDIEKAYHFARSYHIEKSG